MNNVKLRLHQRVVTMQHLSDQTEFITWPQAEYQSLSIIDVFLSMFKLT